MELTKKDLAIIEWTLVKAKRAVWRGCPWTKNEMNGTILRVRWMMHGNGKMESVRKMRH